MKNRVLVLIFICIVGVSFTFSDDVVKNDMVKNDILDKAVNKSEEAFNKCSSFLNLSEEKNILLREIYTDIEIKKIRISENENLRKSKKDLKLLGLRIELDNRIKNITSKDEYQKYLKFKKLLKKESKAKK